MVLALVVGFGVFVTVARRRGITWTVAGVVGASALIGGLVGARLFAALTAETLFFGDFGEVVALRWGNMAMFGGLVGATGAGLGAAVAFGIPPLRLGDAAAPAVGLGIVLLRTGCLLAGCCFGHVTDVPWGIRYPAGSLSHGYQVGASPLALLIGTRPVHPIPVYEMVAAAALAVVAMVVVRRSSRDGVAAAVVAGGYALVRLTIEPLRVAEPGSTPGWFDPAIYLVVVAVAAGSLALPGLRRRLRWSMVGPVPIDH